MVSDTSIFTALAAHYRRRDPLMRGMSFAVIMGIIAMMSHATVEFNLQMPANAATFVVLLSLAWISLNLGSRKNSLESKKLGS